MNLHITHDDKFLDFFIENQEQYSDTKNKYIVYSNTKRLKYIKNKNIDIVKPDLKCIYQKIGDLQNYKTIYIHYLSDFLINFINTLKTNIKVVWIFWGGDGFSQIKNYENKDCLEKETRNFYKKNIRNRIILCKNPFFLYKNYKRYIKKKNQKKTSNYNYIKATQRIDFFAHYIYDDYLLIKNNSHFTAKYVNFNYISTKQTVKIKEGNKKRGGDIIIGNSATITNNHVDVFLHLSKLNLLNINNIYVPLSYGNEDYKKFVVNLGKTILKEKFIPLINFLPLIEYNDILSSVSMAIYGLIRSQAAGNILTLLMGGSRVYMNKKNTLYKLLKSKGVIIFDINVDLKRHLENNEVYFLSKSEKDHNNLILNRLFGEKAIKEKYNKLLKL